MRHAFRLVAAVLIPLALFAQETPSKEQKNPAYVSPSVRLASAKTVFFKQSGGSDVPFNVISGGLEGWGRFVVVDSAEQADIVIDIKSPDDDHTSKSSSSPKTRVGGAVPESAPTNSYDGPIRMVVSDARTHLTLWTASEQPRGGFRQKARDEHLVEAAQHLLTKFRERLEPPPPAK
ncbi:MAG: hypothetical protein ACXVZI_02850 [Terriglobales bacterium]